MKSIEYWITVACRFGPEEGWTDSEEYIRDPQNTSFMICGRWFIKRGDMAECIE